MHGCTINKQCNRFGGFGGSTRTAIASGDHWLDMDLSDIEEEGKD